jgi:hypothetical protein
MSFFQNDLENLTIGELQALCVRYGVKPIGKGAQKQSYITALSAFPKQAIAQLSRREGIKSPTLGQIQELAKILDSLGEPTREQQALVRLSLEGKQLESPYHIQQYNLVGIYRCKELLNDLIRILMMC